MSRDERKFESWCTIRQYFPNDKVGHELTLPDVQAMRAEIVHAFLNDEQNSWPKNNARQEEANVMRGERNEDEEGGRKPTRTRKRK